MRFHIWSYAHLALCLAIGAAGVGFEHAIALSVDRRWPGMSALVMIGEVSGSRGARTRRVRPATATSFFRHAIDDPKFAGIRRGISSAHSAKNGPAPSRSLIDFS